MAITKQNEKPFSFYERDKNKAVVTIPEVPQVMRNPPFRANKIPWKILVPLYRRMVDKIEYERDIRIKKNAEISYALAKLPPRMEEYEQYRKTLSQNEQRSKSVDKLFSF